VALLCITGGGQALENRAIEGRGALGRALPVSPPRRQGGSFVPAEESPRRTPEWHCLAAPPAVDGQTHRHLTRLLVTMVNRVLKRCRVILELDSI